MYAYVQELEQPPLCQCCGCARVAFKQYSHGYFSYCSVKCSSNSQAKQAAMKLTSQTRYGVDNPSAARSVNAKRRATFLERYGAVGVLGNAQVAALARQTCERRFGSPHFFSSEAGKKAVVAGMKKRYGVPNPMQCLDIVQRSLRTRIDQGLICKWTAEQTQSLELYRLAVRMHSECNYQQHLGEINPKRKKRSRHHYHLDHLFPILEGWLQRVPPHLLAHPKNLQLLWCTDNIAKGAHTDLTLAEFYAQIGVAGVMTKRADNMFSLDEDF